ncbi:UDP-glycosyltransferase 85A2 [Raphanus sativus]|uniref:Glycosyltransferase n=1 Tax=Raphanus sativus TaxID=3726 RepID=A0A6J0KLU0_RAPSA|nr:UDP-glycosyltransferase 85A5 [Raphanus sativus]XP_056847617.1 UDP-glycosyltransferase 85A5-like [Raphanus sativus]KAJ4869954.1 UDP-glycosyltransferase 85A2 [Raphanus sativus]KAJ4879645.1 UDP-glycosyltransferase 85A2 [Raphanus sativus]
MASHAVSSGQKPHVVCVPFPAQGHINPMLKAAKLLHAKGFHVTFVNNVYNHNRLLRSRGPNELEGVPSFRFESIPDGLQETDGDTMQDVPSLCDSTMKNCLAPFKELLQRINARDDVPPVTCIVSDGLMTFTLDAAEEIGVPNVIFWTTSACGFLAYLYFESIVQKGLSPIKDENCLDTEIDWIPTMKNLRLKDIPSFIRATTRDDILLNFFLREVDRVKRASAIILNTYDDLERDTIQAIQSITPPVYSIGPLHLLVDRDIDNDSEIGRMGSNLWREDTTCVDWLDTKPRNSVVYVNFGSITVMSAKQLVEFAWGLAATGKDFLWVIRPDLVAGELAVVPTEFLTETADRRMIVSWCPQERVLSHPAVGGFLTHSGWNSTLESLCRGVPMVCWPFFAEQQTNCKFCRDEWEVGMEIGGDVRREEVDAVVRELMDGEKGKKMREKAEKWRCLAEGATEPKRGSSELNFQMFVDKVLLGRG